MTHLGRKAEEDEGEGRNGRSGRYTRHYMPGTLQGYTYNTTLRTIALTDLAQCSFTLLVVEVKHPR